MSPYGKSVGKYVMVDRVKVQETIVHQKMPGLNLAVPKFRWFEKGIDNAKRLMAFGHRLN